MTNDIVTAEKKCPVCEGDEIHVFLTRFNVPIHQNLVFKSQLTASAAARGDLRVGICETCGFVFNLAFDPSMDLYNEAYDNTQTCSPSFKAYTDRLVSHLVSERGIQDLDVVEVGCGKGHFLRSLVEYPSATNRGMGFDPSYEGPLVDPSGRLQFRRHFYGPDCADVKADVVVCRHVIEHIHDPRRFLETIRAALVNNPNAVVFFETPCVEWILQNQVVWDFFYEHCSLFSSSSLKTLFERSGFSVTSVTHTFGGQYLWLEARLAPPSTAPIVVPQELLQLARQFATAEQTLVADLLTRLKERAAQGKVAVWGAGAKGVTLANLIDPHRTLIDCLVDVNPNKQGGFIPGSGHPIVAPERLASNHVVAAMLMNPNYRTENQLILTRAGIEIDLFS